MRGSTSTRRAAAASDDRDLVDDHRGEGAEGFKRVRLKAERSQRPCQEIAHRTPACRHALCVLREWRAILLGGPHLYTLDTFRHF